MFDFFDFVPIEYYSKIFFWTMFVVCLLTGLSYNDSQGCTKLLKSYSFLPPFLFASLLIMYIGLRPFSWAFSDMMMYRHLWTIIDADTYEIKFGFKEEWFFSLVLKFCKIYVDDAHFWFLIVELFYIGCQLWACKRLLWENVWMAILFVFFSYQFYTYGTNGIRNGMACGLMLLSISFFCERKTAGYITGFLLFVLAMGCHRSSMIPMAALMASLFIFKDVKYAIYIWLICIVLSMFTGGFFQGFFASLGLDDRMSNYSSGSEANRTMNQFSRTGFRWDFLLYSAMPVWLAWYVRYKGIINQTFTLLANTYIFANSFWVLVCRVSFSNRFAYLSWFMYAMVIAYAVIRLPIWEKQDRAAGRILIAHSAFTFFMFLLGK
jgi:hypothetical protein